MQKQISAGEDVSPSSRLLIEDIHQGTTSAAAASTVARYGQFIRAANAPIADMNYSPFTNMKQKIMQEEEHTKAQAINDHFSKLHLEEVLQPTGESVGDVASVPPKDLPPGVAHTAPGGEAWTVDFSDWVKTSGSHPGSKRGSVIGSKRGSMSSTTTGVSRKSSMNAGDSKLWSTTSARSRTGGFEASHQIYNMLGTVEGRHYDRGMDLFESSIHLAKEQSSSLGEKGTSRRASVKQPYLRAHQAELKYGLPALANMTKGRGKRASMPPLHQTRGRGLLSQTVSAGPSGSALGSKNTSRRGSLSVHQRAPMLHATRARSQSLPTDSLFLAYSQCALPAVMTSSLASMPVPSQPAIPVAVARRYSILVNEKDLPNAAVIPATLLSSPSAVAPILSENGMVNVNPEQVDGIDTKSVLDTTQLQDLVSPTDAGRLDAEAVAAACPQPARRGSITGLNAAAMLLSSSGSASSRNTSPASSPVDAGEAAAPLPSFSPLAASSATLNLSSLGTTRSKSMIHTHHHSLAKRASLPSGIGAGLRINANLNNLSQSADAPAGAGSSGDSASLQPTPVGLTDSLPDFTPMTSPTNLSHAAFRSTLLSRRMSDVVARDIGQKLAALKKHISEHPSHSNSSSSSGAEEEDGIQALRTL